MIIRKITCPYCFKIFSNREAMHRCTNDETDYKTGVRKCDLEVNDNYNGFWGEETLVPHVFRSSNFGVLGSFKPTSKCDKCGEGSNVFVCPNCCNHIPTEMVQYGSRIISVIGGPSSGKTTYIVSLINRLKKYGHLFGLQIIPQMVGRYGDKKEYTTVKIKDFDDKMFKNHEPLDKTPFDVKSNKKSTPLIFRLEIDNDKSKKEPLYMVFYDTAGEAFKEPETIQKFGKYLESSEAILLLIDILSIDSVYNKLIEIGKIEKNEDRRNDITHYDAIMDTICNYIDEGSQNNEIIRKKILDKPFAFAFSKFDYIVGNSDIFDYHDTGDTPIEFPENVDKNYLRMNNDYFIKQMNNPEKWDCASVNGRLNKFHKKMIFGISSTGGNPKDNKFENGIKPYRVMDPLLWILDELHLINLK